MEDQILWHDSMTKSYSGVPNKRQSTLVRLALVPWYSARGMGLISVSKMIGE
jgi:hypothetical protein